MTSKSQHVIPLSPGVTLVQTVAHLYLACDTPHPVLSSAVLHGGRVQAAGVLNLKVAKENRADLVLEPPAVTLARYTAVLQPDHRIVGMMTAAAMESMFVATGQVGEARLAVVATAGLSNPRRAGDPADYDDVSATIPPGTINLILYTSDPLTEAAQVETLLVATEAKAAALQDLGVISPVSGAIATGTGTDAVALVSGIAGTPLTYVGKHVRFGEVIACLVIRAVNGAVAWDRQYGEGMKHCMPS